MTKFTDRELLYKHAEGLTDAELVALFGVTRQAIQIRRAKWGLAPNKKPKKPKAKHYCIDCGVEIAEESQKCRKCSAVFRLQTNKHHAALLNISQILPIFEARVAGETVPAIAKRFGVHPITIYVVLQRRRWQHVQIPLDLLEKVRATRSPRTKTVAEPQQR